MKCFKQILLLSSVLLFFSCNNKSIAELNSKITELEVSNLKLKDSIKSCEYNKLTNYYSIVIPEELNFKVNDTAKVHVAFAVYDKFKPYNVYTATESGKPDKLLFKNITDSRFKYNFVPDKVGIHTIRLVSVFKIDDRTEVLIPSIFATRITE